ncbi:MAG: Gfo/Idh/MocA family oxidoreductase [Armatimonadota bacterium]|nr:MAG: Gfo/Idh/MocA family oxidoreductase [Armatimonadota bacterium]
MSGAIGMGVVGAGAIGIRGALSHLSLPDVQDRVRLAAVCDPVPGRAAAAAEKFGVGKSYEQFEDLLADPKVEAVTICSPIGLHYEQGMAAVGAGKHVHFNKTMATTVAECDELISAAAERDVRLVASPGMMLHPYNQRIRERIGEGGIGRVVWAAAGAAIGDYHLTEEFRTGEGVLGQVDPTWYFRKPGGGPLYDVTVYPLHNLTGILGPAKRVTALSGLALREREFGGKMIACDMDDSTFMLLDFGDSVFALVYGTVAGVVVEGFHPSIFGTEGSVVGTKLNGEDMKRKGDHQPHVVGKHAKMPESHVFEDMMQLVDWIRDGVPSIATAEQARHVIDIFESGYRAAETGQTQDLVTAIPET